MSEFKPTKQKLRVSHFPQIPCKPFSYEVKNEREAYILEDAITRQHLFLFKNGFIPDYANVFNVEVFNEEDNEWQDYFNEFHELEWDDLCQEFIADIVQPNPDTDLDLP